MSEVPFRIAVVIVGALTATAAGKFRWQAASSGERISHREEGYLFAAVLRLTGVALALATLAYLIHPAWVAWAHLPLAREVRWFGLFLGCLGVPLTYWTLSSLGKNLTDTVVTRAEATLVTHGPYRWVRHPFYTSAAVMMLAVTLLSANGLIGGFSLFALMLLAVRTPKEEEMLIARFGDDYRNYMADTGRYLPRIFGVRKATSDAVKDG